MELAIDPRESQVAIEVGKAGVFGFAGHAHQIVAPAMHGAIVLDVADWRRSTVSVEFDSAALRVSPTTESPSDLPAVQQVMLGDRVLDVRRFPTVAFRSRHVTVTPTGANSADVQVEGDFTLHGVTRPVTVRAASVLDASGTLTTRGAFAIKQTDFNIQPVTAAAGSIRVKDVVDVQFVLKAHR